MPIMNLLKSARKYTYVYVNHFSDRYTCESTGIYTSYFSSENVLKGLGLELFDFKRTHTHFSKSRHFVM